MLLIETSVTLVALEPGTEALGYPDVEKQYHTPISRFESEQLFTFA